MASLNARTARRSGEMPLRGYPRPWVDAKMASFLWQRPVRKGIRAACDAKGANQVRSPCRRNVFLVGATSLVRSG